jgi:hypothetical protein
MRRPEILQLYETQSAYENVGALLDFWFSRHQFSTCPLQPEHQAHKKLGIRWG